MGDDLSISSELQALRFFLTAMGLGVKMEHIPEMV